METRAAQLARQIQDDVLANPEMTNTAVFEATPAQGLLLQTTNSGIQVPLNVTTASTNTVYYTTDELATNNGPEAVFQAQVILSPITMDPAFETNAVRTVPQIEIDVRPAAQTNATPWRFFSRLTPQSSD